MGKNKLIATIPFLMIIAACSSTSSSPATTGGTNSSPGGCTTFVDHTADAEVNLTWDFSITSQADHCSKIKIGSKVKWTGSFTTHPLAGDGPIGTPSGSGGSAEITFPAAGTFAYHCNVHSSMVGAIEVVQ
jgi:plastocyanin